MTSKTLTGILLDEQAEMSMHELCHACSTSTEWVVELVDEGVLEAIGQEQARWRFSGPELQRLLFSQHLAHLSAQGYS